MIARLRFIALLLMLAACTPGADTTGMRVRVIADGKERAFTQQQPITIGQFLQKQGVTLGDFDKVYPPPLAPLSDNATITIIRVTEKDACTEEDFPFQTLTRKVNELPPGERRVIQAGVNGRKRNCAKVTLEDGVEKQRIPGSTTIVAQPVDEIVAVGIDNKSLEPLSIAGTIAYISGGQARVIEGNSTAQRSLPVGGALDGRVFALAGKQLLYTRLPGGGATPAPENADAAQQINELWLLPDVSDPKSDPVRLLDDVLYAEWVPGRANTFSYSTGRWSDKYPGNHEALNDLIIATLDPKTNKLAQAQKLIARGLNGLYAFWGTQFRWSPDGKALAWAQADGVGVVDLKTGKPSKLVDFKVYSATLPRGWLWVPSLSWSPSGGLLAAAIHGPPEAQEAPDASPIFNLVIKPEKGTFEVTLAERVGMWARPQYSPLRADGSEGSLAYLRARDGVNSLNSEYDIVIADRDGSNADVLFPSPGKAGLRPVDDFASDLVWSSDAAQLLCAYQGNLWLIDLTTKRATVITVVDDARLPRWGR